MKQAKPAVKKLAENLDFIKEKLGYGVTFDLLVREITVGGKRAALVGECSGARAPRLSPFFRSELGRRLE